jgi:formylmethanofuran dehydrogenase subunit A
MFQLPRYVIKAGRVIVEDGEIREPHDGKTLHVAPDYDRAAEADIESWLQRYYTVQFANYPVGDDYVPHAERVACASASIR